jgi:hypothetical protein
MKKIISLLTIMGIGFSSFAQNMGKISGSIKDGGNQKIIDAASVSLLNAKDSALLKTSITDKDGNFIFENVKDGNYLVMATSLGHIQVYSRPIAIGAGNSVGSAGVLQLVVADKNMKEVVVTAKKQFIERKLDKTILNVEASITNTGSTAMEVLEKAPGVSVDKDGNISLKGKQGVIIMMDGKPTYMSGPDLANFLRNLPASNLDQIEIMTNPSSKYDAAGNSGIINIKTKKNKLKGFNGSLTTAFGQGTYSKTNNSLNLNYRIGKVNLFGTLSGNYREEYQELDINRRYKNADGSTKAIFDQVSFAKKYRNNYNAKLGMDYYASKKTTLGFVLTGYTTPGTEVGTNTSYLQNSMGIVDSIVTAQRNEKYTWKNGAINLNMRHTFDSAGRELTADVDYLQYAADRDQYFINNRYNPDWTKKSGSELVGELPSDIKVYSAKADYTHPFKKELKLETGVKFSYVSTDNDAGYYNILNGIKTVDYDKTNKFQYKENINAAYVNLSKTIKKWGFQAGLRLENTNYEGRQFGNAQHPEQDSSFKNHYTNLFPTAYISYNASEKNQFGLSYGRRINRPDYEDLNPFLFFLDEYTLGAGNPFLRPMYSHVFELNHTYNQFLTTSLNYSRTTDLFNETFEEVGYKTIVRQGNYGLNNNASLSISAQVPVAKWWKSIIYTEGRYQQFKGKLYGDDLNVKGTNFLVNVNNQFSFKKGWSAELSGFYRTKGIEGQILIKPIGMVNAGVQKQVLKNKGTLKLSARDIFKTLGGKGNINFQSTEANFRNTNDSRVATVSFNYRFGKPIKGLQKRKTGGAGDEQNRIKSSN